MTDALLLYDGRPLADSIAWAHSPADRMRGLLGRRLTEGQALVIAGARQVHTFGMRYAIDVLFCDAGWVVHHKVARMAPRRITRWVGRARWAIELPGGTVEDVRVGEGLAWSPRSPAALVDPLVRDLVEAGREGFAR